MSKPCHTLARVEALEQMLLSLDERLSTVQEKVAKLEKAVDSIKRLVDNRVAMTVSEAGRKGGSAKVKKGPAALPASRRAEILAKARAAKAEKRRREGK